MQGTVPDTAPSTGRPAAPPVAGTARLLSIPAGFYALRLAPGRFSVGAGFTALQPAVRISAAPGAPALNVVDLNGRDGSWLVGSQGLFLTAPPGGTVVLLTGYFEAGHNPPLDIEIRCLDRPRPDGQRPPVRPADRTGVDLIIGLSAVAAMARFKAAVLLRDEGERRFVDAEWIGRLGSGHSIESFSLLPDERLPSIEYKGLTANGRETAWISAGEMCGTRGANAAIIGFAVRQRPGSGPALFDCEYSGAFQSGVVTGPVRNGAPCLSSAANDPLEGLQLRLVPRPPRQAG